MGLSGLDAALSGLRTSQQQIGVLSGNIANVSTPGYSRKILPQSTQAIEGVTVGVRSDTIIRKVDVNLQRDLWTQISSSSFHGIRETYLSRVQDFHGPPDQELSIAAKISDLLDAFTLLADSPENTSLQNSTLNTATDLTSKINDFAQLLTTMRNDTQADIQQSVSEVNTLLDKIADLNTQIASNKNGNRTTAALEDSRDIAIKELSGYIDISFYQRGDGVLVVQTEGGGVLLASTSSQNLTFRPQAMSSSSAYPDSAAGIFVGDPTSGSPAYDITEESIGGKLGALIDLRDVTLPVQMAQLDELAHKLALRFDAQGLRLFTDSSGSVPADTAPNPSVPTPVSYLGFASEIRINQAILDNHALLQQGTAATDLTVQAGSNEVIRRVVEFSFGDIAYQQAVGTVDVRAAATGTTDLQDWLGVFSSASVTGNRNIALPNYTDIADLVAAANGVLDDPADQFQITFEESRTGLGPTTVTIDLSAAAAAFPIGGGVTDALDQIISQINAQITAAGVDADLAAVATRSASGQIVISSRGSIEVDASFGANAMGATGLSYLGLVEGETQPVDPYFDVKVGNGQTRRVTIEPGDDETDLLDKLNYDGGSDTDGVPGLGASYSATTGFLTVRPGDNTSSSLATFGGDFVMTSGSFRTDGSGGSGLPAGVNLVSALFGSYSAGPPVQNTSPISNMGYGSTVSSSDSSVVGFRSDNLGPLANISTGVDGAISLTDYAQKMISQQTQEFTTATAKKEDQEALRDILQTQLVSESGVNLDEELSQLIVYQTSFAASARVINAVDDLFQQLLSIL